jgi:hypothetical protein
MNKLPGIEDQLAMGRFSMIPDFTAYMTKPAKDLAPVLTLSLSLMASTVLGLSSTKSAISFVLFSPSFLHLYLLLIFSSSSSSSSSLSLSLHTQS